MLIVDQSLAKIVLAPNGKAETRVSRDAAVECLDLKRHPLPNEKMFSKKSHCVTKKQEKQEKQGR